MSLAPTFLVTGGTGFIGRRLVARLLATHSADAIVCLVHRPSTADQAAALADFQAKGIRLIDGDLNDAAVAAVPPPAVHVVFHLAANIDTALAGPELTVNDIGTANLLNWLSPVLPGVRVVYTSSVAVLDRAAVARGPLTETSPCTPRTAYGRTKLRGENIIRDRAATDRYTYTIARLATIYGPGAKAGGLFNELFELTAADKLLGRVDWPGRCSVMHVDDVAKMLASVCRQPGAANEIYCAADAYAPTVGELAQRIGRLSGHTASRIRPPAWVWSALRSLTWNPVIQRLCLLASPAVFWRFTLIIDDGFWVDPTKMQSVFHDTLVDLDIGLQDMVAQVAHLVSQLS